jgi:hypothetical protein
MKIILTKQESEDIFFDAMCNGLAYVCGYGFEIDFSRKDYAKAKDNTSNGAFEEVLMQILRDGGSITLADVVNNGSETSTITLQDVHERVSDVDARVLIEAINEEGDADTADAVLQTVFFKEVTFG